MRFYLAHPWETRHDLRKQELECEQQYGIELHNPFYDEEWRKFDHMKALDSICKDDRHYTKYEEAQAVLNAAKEDRIVENDVMQIEKSEGVIANLPHRGVGGGTWMEIWIATRMNRAWWKRLLHFLFRFPFPPKRVIIITEEMDAHPWLRFCVKKTGGFFAKSLSEAVERIVNKVGS